MKVTIESEVPFTVNGQQFSATTGDSASGEGPAPQPPATIKEPETFKQRTSYQFGNHPKGMNFPLPEIDPYDPDKEVTFTQGGKVLTAARLGNGTQLQIDTGGKPTVMRVTDGKGGDVPINFNPTKGDVVPFRFVVDQSGYAFGCHYPEG